MNPTSKATLDAIQKLLAAGVATQEEAILSAYRLGKFDGMLEMASFGQAQVSELIKEAA